MLSRRNLLLCFVVLHIGISDAQNVSLIDSLKRKLSGQSVKDKFTTLNLIGFEFRYSHPDSTIYYCNKAYQLGSDNDLFGLAEPLNLIGLAAMYKGDYEDSYKYYDQGIQTAILQQDSVQIAYGYNNLGRLFFDQGDYVRAYNNFLRAKDIFEILNNMVGLAYVHRSLSNVYKSQNEFGKAIESSREALKLRQRVGDPRAVTSSWMELGLVQQSMGDKKGAIQSFQKADSIAKRIEDKVTELEVHAGMAETWYEDGNSEAALDAANSILDVVSSNTNQKLFLRAALIKARYYFDKNQLTTAQSQFDDIMSEANESGSIEFQKDASYYLNLIHLRKGNKQLAKEYSDRFAILKEMIQNTDLTRQIERLQFQLEIEKKERENELLKANKAKNEALITQQRFNNILLIVTVAFVTVVMLVSIRANRKRRIINRKLEVKNRHILIQQDEIAKRNSDLSKRNEELRELNHEKDTLMNIVAHDLKAPLNRIQGLTALIETESGAKPEYLRYLKLASQSGLDLITDLLDVNALEDERNTPKMEPFEAELLLREKLEQFDSMAKSKSIALELENNVSGKLVSNESYLNRIIDNLLSNAIKFSPRNSKVLMSATYESGSLTMRIKDQGPGFTDEDQKFLFQKFKKLSARPTGGESSNGLGLAIVKILLERLGGEIELKTDPQTGSEFTLKIPVTENIDIVEVEKENRK